MMAQQLTQCYLHVSLTDQTWNCCLPPPRRLCFTLRLFVCRSVIISLLVSNVTHIGCSPFGPSVSFLGSRYNFFTTNSVLKSIYKYSTKQSRDLSVVGFHLHFFGEHLLKATGQLVCHLLVCSI